MNSPPSYRLIDKKTGLLSEPDKPWVPHCLRLSPCEEKLQPTSSNSGDDDSQQKQRASVSYTFHHMQEEFEKIMFSLLILGLHVLEG